MTDKLARFYALRTAVRKPAISAGKVTAALITLALITPYATVAGATCLALPLAYGMIIRPGVRSFKQNSFLNSHPNDLAHLVPSEIAMIDYIKVVGRDEAVRQVERAFRHGIDLTEPARKLLAKYADQFDPKKLDEYLETLDKKTPFKSALADDGAIDTKAITAQNEKTKSSGKGDSAIEKIDKDVVQAFLDDLRCTVLCAPPRTGKGVVAAAMMLGFKMQYPAGKLFSCTIKQFAGEDWYFEPSDAHINPDAKHATVEAAAQIYQLFRAFESSESSAVSPSLLVLDEIRDTIGLCNKVIMGEVDTDYQFPDELFVDWLRKELVMSATMNQCHKRYILLISPVSTATAMGFKDANSLKSYASFTLVTPDELAFTEGSNGAFAAPAIRPDSPLFKGLYGLAWSSKGKKWLGVPAIDVSVIKLRESQPPKLNYFAKPVYVGEQRYPAEVYGDRWKAVTDEFLSPLNKTHPTETGTPAKVVSILSKSTATKAPAKVEGVEVTQKELENQVYEKLCEKIVSLGGEKTTLAKLKRNLSRKHSVNYSQLIENLIIEDERFDYEIKERSNGDRSISIWLITDTTTEEEDD